MKSTLSIFFFCCLCIWCFFSLVCACSLIHPHLAYRRLYKHILLFSLVYNLLLSWEFQKGGEILLPGPDSLGLHVLEDALLGVQRMIRSCAECAQGWPQGSSKLTTLFCGQLLVNEELLSASVASCHQPHGVNGEEVRAGGWPDSRMMQPLLA